MIEQRRKPYELCFFLPLSPLFIQSGWIFCSLNENVCIDFSLNEKEASVAG